MQNTKQDIIDRAKRDFTALVTYYTVTRAKRLYVDSNGNFDKGQLLADMKFLGLWNDSDSTTKDVFNVEYAKKRNKFNLCFSIPRRMVCKALGFYADGNRVKVDDIREMIDSTFTVVNHGTKSRKDENGTYTAKAHWANKYFFRDKKLWLTMLADSRYDKVETIPDISNKMIRVILSMVKSEIQTHTHKADDSQPQQKQPSTTPTVDSTFTGTEVKELIRSGTLTQNELEVLWRLFKIKFNGVPYDGTNYLDLIQYLAVKYPLVPLQREKNFSMAKNLIERIAANFKNHKGLEWLVSQFNQTDIMR